ncbi:Sec-independent protein translocase protein TatB [Roseibaca sp. V10]|uniref:Sec-independent protein translocase protein TatB n=1 Tax=Roseinatronobacter domitianus TaxID=2940293 RepID=A0ABT0LX47_9RHOB|nr:Sec-independent protein translocase protein TatB [Roseibaca domitiana]MCL1627171.1 Sec-independent protein translocase protein TatB [Roseibaca domitiana]
MFDLGWTELLVIGVVALIVVGPKDLPKMFRTLGQATAKARSMAREFSRAMEDAADQTGVKDVARDLRGMTNPQGMGLDELNQMKNWNPLKDDPAPGSKDKKPSAPGDDEDEIDRIATEMDNMRSDAAKRAAPKPDAAQSAEASPNAAKPDAEPTPASASEPLGHDAKGQPAATRPKGGTDSTT